MYMCVYIYTHVYVVLSVYTYTYVYIYIYICLSGPRPGAQRQLRRRGRRGSTGAALAHPRRKVIGSYAQSPYYDYLY